MNQLGGDPTKVIFTRAFRPRTGKPIRICVACEITFGRAAFREPEIEYFSDRIAELY